MAGNSAGSVFIDLKLNTDDFDSGIKGAAASAKTVEGGFGGVKSIFSGLGDKMKSVFGAGVSGASEFGSGISKAMSASSTFGDTLKGMIGANLLQDIGSGMKEAAGAAKEMVSDFLESAGGISEASQKVGLSAESYQKWDYAMKQSGTSMDQCSMGVKTLTSSIDDANNGSKAAIEKFNRIGISVDDLKGKSREDIFAMTVNSLQNVSDESERAALATDMFGRSGQSMIPLLNQGADATNAAMQSAENYGMVLSDDAAASADTLDDSITTLKSTFGGFKNQLVSQVAPGLTMITDAFSGLLSGASPDATSKITDGVNSIVEGFSSKLPQITSILTSILSAIISTLPTIVSSLIGAIDDVIGGIITSIKGNSSQICDTIITSITGIITDISDNMADFLDIAAQIFANIVASITQHFPEIIQSVSAGIANVLESIGVTDVVTPIIDLLVTASEAIAENMPMIVDGIVDAIPQIVSGIVKLVNGVIKSASIIIPALVSGLQAIVTALIQQLPILLPAIVQGVTAIIDMIVSNLPAMFDMTVQVLVAIAQAIAQNLPTLLNTIITAIPMIIETILAHLPDIITAVMQIALAVVEAIITNIPAIIEAIISIVGSIIEHLPEIIVALVEGIAQIQLALWDAIANSQFGKDVVNFFSGIGDAICKSFQAVGDFFTGLWDGLIGAIKGVINGILGFINGMIKGFCDGINVIINALDMLSFKVPDWVPNIGGQTIGFTLKPITAPQIPMLAKGGIVSQPTLAMVGEAGPEAIVPLSGSNSPIQQAAPEGSVTKQDLVEFLGRIIDAINGIDVLLDGEKTGTLITEAQNAKYQRYKK